MRLKLTLQYKGTDYHGWQRIEEGPSVQAEVERALQVLNKNKPVEVFAAGRTDKGVHARGQVIHADLDTNFPLIRYLDGVNANLRPHPIRVTEVEEVSEDFHARFLAERRTYSYTLYNRRQIDPLLIHRAGLFRTELDWNKIEDAIAHIPLGENDWTSFRSAECQAKHPNVHMYSISLKKLDAYTYRFEISANRFLHHMVRTIIGTLLEIGEGKREIDDFPHLLKAKDRTKAGSNANASGLVLESVSYPDYKILQKLHT